MLIRNAHLAAIATGQLSLAFRRWRKPSIKAGGTLRTAIGVIAIQAVDVVSNASLSSADAQAAGYSSLADLKAELSKRSGGNLYRIRLHLAGPDPRVQLRSESKIALTELAEISRKLERWDARSTHGPWTESVLRTVDQMTACKAADLAVRLCLEKEWLKIRIRKLKELGLTESLESGYRLSPREGLNNSDRRAFLPGCALSAQPRLSIASGEA